MREKIERIIELAKELNKYTWRDEEENGFSITTTDHYLLGGDIDRLIEELGVEAKPSNYVYYDERGKEYKRRYEFEYNGFEFCFFKVEYKVEGV